MVIVRNIYGAIYTGMRLSSTGLRKISANFGLKEAGK